MGVDEVSVDFLSLDDFREHLEPRRQEAVAALAALTDAHRLAGEGTPGAGRPELGGFHDAEMTAERYAALRDEYLLRLRRLVTALDAAQAATAEVLATYRTMDALNTSTIQEVTNLLSPGDKASGDGLPSGR